ncbi:cache domain-containing protein [Palleronia abyssalis]|uniref:HAMP domain-containing protein n=1 Tax=Palleronia abyssalis TaxID=1501240 RepID=A0A2R8C0U3_9RHOB|nr:cache domain-containing protein [Palleronia abyssalis]SPJ25969.1 hypothetical protein PAA8504_03825 [Palleronia abyssalis]
MSSRTQTPITLPGALTGLVLIGILLFSGAAYVLVRDRVGTFQEAAMEQAVSVRAAGAAKAFARALEQDWQHLAAIATEITALDTTALRPVLDAAAGPDQRISWAGLARPDGEVVAASEGLLEGADVGARPWFQQGLQGDFAGDMHEAVLLADLMAAEDVAPPRFLDMSIPVEGPGGRMTGVLGFHINAAWAEEYLADMATALEMDLVLINANGEVMIGTDPAIPARIDLPSLGTAAAGVAGAGYEIWPDDRRYFTTVIPDVTHGALPPFGWRLIGRIDPGDFPITPGHDLLRTAGIVFAVTAAAFLLAAALFIRLYLTPVGRLAQNAERIAEGHEEYPAEIRATAELQRLSASLARLEAQRN